MQAHSGQRNQALVDQGSGHLIFHGFLLFPDPLLHSLSLSAGITPHTAAAKSCQSCPTLLNPIDGSPTDSSVSGILQARTLEWGAIAFSDLSHYSHSVHVPLPKIVIGMLFSVFYASLNFTQYLISYIMNS